LKAVGGQAVILAEAEKPTDIGANDRKDFLLEAGACLAGEEDDFPAVNGFGG